MNKSKFTGPNIFQFATSELSQDAFLLWLVSWAQANSKNDEPMIEVGRSFISSIFQKANIDITGDIVVDWVSKQEHQIDVLFQINDQYIIIIEDKTYSKQSPHQLKKYYDYVVSKYGDKQIIPIYFKPLPQPDITPVLEQGYHIYNYYDLISVLDRYRDIDNDILVDFILHLDSLHYSSIPFKNWNLSNWLFFFESLLPEFENSYFTNWQKRNIRFEWNWSKSDFISLRWNISKRSPEVRLMMFSEGLNQFDQNLKNRIEKFSEIDWISIDLRLHRKKSTQKPFGYVNPDEIFELRDGFLMYEATLRNIKKLSKEHLRITKQYFNKSLF